MISYGSRILKKKLQTFFLKKFKSERNYWKYDLTKCLEGNKGFSSGLCDLRNAFY